MTISFEVGICHLLTEFPADALIFVFDLEAARTVSALTLQALADVLDDLSIFIESNSHRMPHIVNFVPCGVSISVTPSSERIFRISSARA